MATHADIYEESLDWIKSVNNQMRSPGAFISSRLEDVSLEHVHREFSALLLATQSHSSALIRTVFADASLHDENLKMIIKSLWPVKDRITESCRSFEPIKDEYFLLKNRVQNLLNRVAMVSYAKATIITFMEAQEYFINVCTEVSDCLSSCNPLTDGQSATNFATSSSSLLGPSPGGNSVVSNNSVDSKVIDTTIKMMENIANRGYRLDGIIENSLAWTLFELVPKELSHISLLLERCKGYELKLDEFGGSLEWVVSSETTIGQTAKLREYSVEKMERDIDRLKTSLSTTIELSSSKLFSLLYRAYIQTSSDDAMDNSALVSSRIEEEIKKLLSGLTSVIKGYNELCPEDCNSLVKHFVTNFLDPFLQSNRLDAIRDDSDVFATLGQELDLFPKFVDYVEAKILNEENSLLMRFMNDLSRRCGLETFKTCCMFDGLAIAIFNHIDENHSWIFTAVYPEYFFQNYKAFERLLTLIETHADESRSHLFKWRGSLLPCSLSQRFCTGMICDNFVDNICTNVFKEFTRYHDIDGNFFISEDKKFYIRSSYVVYDEIFSMFSEKKFLHHLFPQYLKGLHDIFWGYIGHINSFIAHMESSNDGGATSEQHWPSGLSFAYSTYVLHDVVVVRDCFLVSKIHNGAHGPSDQTLGSIAKILLEKAGYPLFSFIQGFQTNRLGSENMMEGPLDCWFKIAEMEKMLLDKDLKRLFAFTRELYEMICTFLSMAYDKVDAMKVKLENYIIKSLYTSSKCSLQFIQSISSKFRGSNKVEPKNASDYIKFLVAPLSSFKEFSNLVITNQESEEILSKTITCIVPDYVHHIKILFDSVESLNSSITRASNITLDDQSKDFLIVDISMIKKQISKDVTEFYDTCQTKFKVNASTCPELEALLEYTVH